MYYTRTGVAEHGDAAVALTARQHPRRGVVAHARQPSSAGIRVSRGHRGRRQPRGLAPGWWHQRVVIPGVEVEHAHGARRVPVVDHGQYPRLRPRNL